MAVVLFSFGVLKPDCVQRGLVEQAFALIAQRGLRIVLRKKVILSRIDVIFLYGHLSKKDFFSGLVDFMTSTEVVIFVVKSQDFDAVRELNSVTGHTNPSQAKPGTLRSMGNDVCHNISHSSSDEVTARKDILHFLTEEELRNIGLV